MTADAALIIGRWQILQRGHCTLLRAALALAPKVVVVIGSAFRSRDARNPFNWRERREQFEAVLSPEERERVIFVPLRDYYDDDRWGEALRAAVREAAPDSRIRLLGFRKDATSGYLDQFPEWPLREIAPEHDVNAADLRAHFFGAQDRAQALKALEPHVEPGVLRFLEAWSLTPAYEQCATEYRAVVEYRKKYTAPVSLTADALVTVSGHVLLIRRGGNIGHGLWALPGGFLDPDERFYPAAVRELAEETGLTRTRAEMKQALRGEAVFDHPLRSARGRIITCVFHFDLGEGPLPPVKGTDDAKDARWVPVGELTSMEESLFEDHGVILDRFLGLFPRPGT